MTSPDPEPPPAVVAPAGQHPALLTWAALKVLGKKIEALLKDTAPVVAEEIAVGDRVTVRDPAGDHLPGVRIARANGAVKLQVTDEHAYLRWVQAHRPDQIDTSPRVHPAFTKLLGTLGKKAGAIADPATGEIIPGVAMADGDPYLTPQIETAAADQLFERMRGGGLSLSELLAGPPAVDAAAGKEPTP